MATKASDDSKVTKTKKAPAASAKSTLARKATSAEPARVPKVPKVPKPSKVTAGRTTLPAVSERQRGHYIEVAAFYIAERRNFVPGDALADWLAAEAQVDRLIAEGKLGR